MEKFFAAIGGLVAYLAGIWLIFFAAAYVVAIAILLGTKVGLEAGPTVIISLLVCMIGGWIYDWAKAQKIHTPK